jgi:hypothetical protein
MCIFAGYEEPMKQFIEANPGLRSRIGFTFKFSDYGIDEMKAITEYQAKELGFKLPPDIDSMLTDYYSELMKLQGDVFGNGREARKLLESAALELASRLSKQKRKPSKVECITLTLDDIGNAIRNSIDREKLFGHEQKRTIGFNFA